MSWTIGLPPGVKVVSRVKACLLGGGVVKISLSEAMLPKGSGQRASCWFGAADHAGQMRVAFVPDGALAVTPYRKGGAYLKVKFEGDIALLNGLSTESKHCEVLSTGEGGFVVKLPDKNAIRADVPVATNGDDSDRLDMLGYLKKKGHKVTTSGMDGFSFNGKRLTRAELLGEVNRARRAENLRPLALADVE